jgi:hypothetical protein
MSLRMLSTVSNITFRGPSSFFSAAADAVALALGAAVVALAVVALALAEGWAFDAEPLGAAPPSQATAIKLPPKTSA